MLPPASWRLPVSSREAVLEVPGTLSYVERCWLLMLSPIMIVESRIVESRDVNSREVKELEEDRETGGMTQQPRPVGATTQLKS